MRPSVCNYCGADVDHRPYAGKRDMPSVTGVLEMLDGGKSRSFGWAASLIASVTAVHHPDRWAGLGTDGCTGDKDGLCPACIYLRSEFDRQWRAQADLGTHVHHLALSWAVGEEIDVDAHTAPYLDALEKFWVEADPEWLHLERTVLYDRSRSHAYRGQFDWIARVTLNGERRTLLGDIKTGRYSPHSQTLQLAAYRFAQLTRWEDKTEIVEGPVPVVDGAAVLLLGDDGTCRLVELPAAGDAHSTFLRLRDLWGWHRQIDRWSKDHPYGIQTQESAA